MVRSRGKAPDKAGVKRQGPPKFRNLAKKVPQGGAEWNFVC